MPEGDTVWLTAKRLDDALRARPLTVSDLRVPRLATLDLRGRTVLGVVPRGKHLLTRFDDGTTLHSHLRMDGSWDITPAGRRSHRHAEHLIRVLLGNEAWLATGYRIHDLQRLPTSDEQLVVGHLGPDLLGADGDADEAVRRLRAPPDVPIGEALLDQRNLAGIGNLYKCEVLFLAGVHPDTPVHRVADLAAIVSRAQRLMSANREHPEQSTTGLLARGRRHYVYERAGEPCLRCRTPVVRTVSGPATRERSSYWCPACQPPPG
jgi:endonuclease-8